MKKTGTTIFLVLLALLLTLSGCGAAPDAPDAPRANAAASDAAQAGVLRIVATNFAPYDFARVIAGEHAQVTMLLPPGTESHSFEPTPQDIIAIQNCDVFLYIGGESDAWVRDVLAAMDGGKRQTCTLMDCVEPVEEETVEGMETEEEHGDEHDTAQESEHETEGAHGGIEYDEHVWTAPKNAKRIVQKIADTLCAADGAHRDAYEDNARAYIAELDALDAAFQAVVDGAARKTIVFGDRFPFRYLADAYGLRYYAAFPGCSTETEPSAATVAFLIQKIKAEGIPVVFHVELSNRKMAESIGEATGAKVLLLHACHNISKAEFLSGVGYLELMRQNVENLKEALQ